MFDMELCLRVQPGTALLWNTVVFGIILEIIKQADVKTVGVLSSHLDPKLTRTRGSEIKCCLFSNKMFNCFSCLLFFTNGSVLAEILRLCHSDITVFTHHSDAIKK